MSEQQPRKLITAKEAEAEIPALENQVGNYKIIDHFRRSLLRPPEADGNVMIEGLPGSGKTVVIIGYLRVRLNNPDLFNGDYEEFKSHPCHEGIDEHDARYFQTRVPYKIYAFVRIDGATDSKKQLERKIQDTIYGVADHKFVLLDEAGELYFNGLEECLRPLLTDPHITTYANAQNFHSKRKTDNRQEQDARLQAFLRRFTHRFSTDNPTKEELMLFLIQKLKDWQLKLDHPSTLRLILLKSGGVVGLALRPLICAIDRPDRKLTRDLVEGYDVDPNVT
jgi:hypothetical protein